MALTRTERMKTAEKRDWGEAKPVYVRSLDPMHGWIELDILERLRKKEGNEVSSKDKLCFTMVTLLSLPHLSLHF
jgi:hypothetical protein